MLKKIIFTLTLSIAQSIFVFSYCSEPRSATMWYGFQYYQSYPYEGCTPVITDILYGLEGDTLINDKHYRQIRYTNEYENITNVYRGAIRQSEDGQQVYYIPWGSNLEYLLYDFDVKPNDTIYAYGGFNDISCEELAEIEQDREITPAWVVVSMQTIDGRKHISVQNKEYGVDLEWIEGIGTRHILWAQGRTCYATGLQIQFQHTLCAVDSEGNILYSYDTDYLGIRNNCPDWELIDEAVDNVSNETPSATKILRDGHLYIIVNEKEYTADGMLIR